ncbi:MAG TPA: DUF2461 domain-containing protein [Myxococcales bacterium]|nr:DUF2461 domain-containing protein [Myxococcales bacterium]
MPFEGFPKEGVSFLAQLARHNERDWFEAHRAVWDDQIVPAMLSWCSQLCEVLRDVMPRLVFVPRVGGSLYRLNRDIRFSRDKSPYKTHVAALLWEGGDKHDAPGIYLHIAPSEVLFGGGMWIFEQEGRLDRYRKRLQDERSAQRLESALSQARKAGLAIEAAEKLKRPPRPFTPEHPRAELSLYKGLTVGKRSTPAAWLHSAEALKRSEAVARAYAPLHAWLRDELCG